MVPRILDRYLVRQILPPLILALTVFTFLLLMPPLSLMAEQLLAKGVPWTTVAFLLLTLLPQALAITIPIAFLLGLLVAFGRLSADSEWVALQACGVSLLRLLRPVALMALLAWASTSYVIIWAVPWGNMTWKEITFNILATWAETDIKPRVFFEGFPRLVLYVREAPPGTHGWQDVFVAQTGNTSQPIIHLARRGRMVVDRSQRTVDMVLEDGSTHDLTQDSQGRQQYRVSQFRSTVIRLDPTAVFPNVGATKLDNEMTIPELRQQAAELRARGESDHNPIWTLHNKFAIPVACLVYALLGMSIGFSTARSGKLGSFVLGVGIVFVHWIVMYLGRNLAKGGAVPAWFASWLPDLVLGIVGIVFFARRVTAAEGPLQITLPFGRRRGVPALAPDPGSADDPAGRAAAPMRRVVVVVRFPRLGLPRPRILDVYMSRLFGRLFAVGFMSFLGIFYIATFIDLSEKLFKGRTTLGTLAAFLWFKTPQFMYFVIPLAVLIAALVAIGMLSRNSELVVMKACGLSLYRIAVPLVISGVLGSGALFLIEETLLGPANRRAEMLEAEIRDRPPRVLDVLNRRWVVSRSGEIFHYVFFDSRRGELNGLTVYEFDREQWRLVRRTYTAQARAPRDVTSAPGTGRRWTAIDGWVREFDTTDREPEWQPFRQRLLVLEPLEYFGREQPDAERMTYMQLQRHVAELEKSGFDTVGLHVDLQRKLSFPFITVVMTLIAIPFAVATGRRGALYGIGAGIALAMAYWMTGNFFGAIGTAGLTVPWLAAWAPNMLFGTAAVYLMLTVRT